MDRMVEAVLSLYRSRTEAVCKESVSPGRYYSAALHRVHPSSIPALAPGLCTIHPNRAQFLEQLRCHSQFLVHRLRIPVSICDCLLPRWKPNGLLQVWRTGEPLPARERTCRKVYYSCISHAHWFMTEEIHRLNQHTLPIAI